ncbi:VWA domain-containing protein, partial [Candidatus Woesearchaeota archaeon]|nr:VWA domain-containing protein [Candidatus Woesearchaeota archaeon]
SAKKAGLALAYKAMEERDKVGLIIFGDEIKQAIRPTEDFTLLLKELTKVTASKETNITLAIKKAAEMFSEEDSTKHLIILTDALPTAGKEPEKDTLNAAAEAKAKEITISIVGINLDKQGEKLGIEIAKIGEGKLYKARNLEEIDKIVLEDYSGL